MWLCLYFLKLLWRYAFKFSLYSNVIKHAKYTTTWIIRIVTNKYVHNSVRKESGMSHVGIARGMKGGLYNQELRTKSRQHSLYSDSQLQRTYKGSIKNKEHVKRFFLGKRKAMVQTSPFGCAGVSTQSGLWVLRLENEPLKVLKPIEQDS